jgi:hypothetical protein
MEGQPALRRDRADGANMSAYPPSPPRGELADRSIGADDAGQGIKARFVYKEVRPLLGLHPFFDG